MAVTEKNITSTGATSYTFEFEYLKTTDVKVSVNGTATTEFQVPNGAPTTVQFNTGHVPASGAAIRIYRDTNVDNLEATFYAGSAIKSQDLNDNFNQNLYVTQEAKRDAAAAWQDGDETIHSTETWQSDNTHVATTGAIDGRVDAKIDTALTSDVSGGDGVTIVDNNPGTGQIRVDLDTDIATLKDMQSGAATQLAALTSTELAILDGATVTTAQLNRVDATSSIQTQLDDKQDKDDELTELASMASTTAAALADLNENEVKILDGATVTTAELNRVDATSSIQTQLNDKQDGSTKLTELATMHADTASALADLTQEEVQVIDGVVTTGSTAVTTNIINNALGGLTSTKDELNVLDGVTLTGASAVNTSQINKLGGLNASTAELNIVAGKSFKTSSGTLDTTSDTEIPSSKVIAAHVASSQTAIGGFVTIADEVSFPNTQPATGVVVSINNAAGVVVNGSGVSTSAKRVDNTSVTINGFPSSLNSETLAAGVGLVVTSTSTANTYTYHKLLAAETDVKQLSDDINDFNARYRVASSAPGSNNDAGDMYFDTSANKMKVYNGTTNAWDDVASVGSFYVNTISSSSGTGGGSATFNNNAYRFTLSNAGTSAQQHIVSVNGVIQKPNTGTSQPSEGFAISGNDIIFAAAPASGSDSFIITCGSSVSIGTPSANSVNSSHIIDGSIVNGDISSSADIALSKLNTTGTASNSNYLRGDGAWSTIDLSTKADLSGATFTGDVTLESSTSGKVVQWDKSADTLKVGIGLDIELEDESVIRFKNGLASQTSPPSEGLMFGASGSEWLKIYNDTSQSHIIGGISGGLHLQGARTLIRNNVPNDMLNVGATDVKLYHSDGSSSSEKLATTSTGINVTGSINVNGTALSTAPEITATATGALAIEEACIVRADGTIEKVTGQNEAIGSAVEYHSGSGSDYIAPMRVVYNPDKNNNVIFYLKGTGSNSQYPTAYCRSVTISGTTVSYGTQRQIPTDDSSNQIGGYLGWRGLDCCYDTTNNRFMLTYINKDWGRVHTAVGYANTAGDDITWGAGNRLMGNPDTQGTKHLRCCFNPDNSKVALFWNNSNNHVWMAQGQYYSDNADWNWTTNSTQVTSVSSNGWIEVDYDTNLDRYLAVWRHSSGSNQVYSRSFNNTLGGSSNTVTTAGGEVSTHACVFVPGANKFVEVYSTNSDTYKLIAKVGTISSSGSNDPSWGSEVFIDTDTNCTNISAVLDSTNNKVIATWYNGVTAKRYASVGTISGTVTTWTPRFEVLAGAGQSAVGYNANAQKAVIAVRDGGNNDEGDAAAYVPPASNLTTENFIGFAKAATSNGATGAIKVVGNTATKSSLTPGQKYYVQFDGSIGTAPVTGTEVEAGIALSSTKLLIK